MVKILVDLDFSAALNQKFVAISDTLRLVRVLVKDTFPAYDCVKV